jgi:hypothetical protein
MSTIEVGRFFQPAQRLANATAMIVPSRFPKLPPTSTLPATAKIVHRQVAAVREIVGRAERQNSHRGPRRLLSLADERVDHGVDRPVPATGEDPRGAGVERLLHDSALVPLVPGDAHAKIDSSSADVPNGLLDLRPVGRLPV